MKPETGPEMKSKVLFGNPKRSKAANLNCASSVGADAGRASSENRGHRPRLQWPLALIGLLLFPMLGNAEYKTITSTELSETIVPADTIVRVIDTDPAAVYVGDGETLGGIRVGDGNDGWTEGTPLSQDLYTGGHTIHIGDLSLINLYGWSAIQGGSISSDGQTHIISVNGDQMLQLTSELSLVNIQEFNWVSPYFEITTTLGDTVPTIMFSTNLVGEIWNEITPAAILTNDTTLVFQLDPPDAYGYFRATIPSGTGSKAEFSATIYQQGETLATDAELAEVSGQMSAVSNLAASAYSTATNNTALISTKAVTGAVYRVVLNGTTNSPTSGTVNLGELVTALQDSGTVNGTNRTATLNYDFTNGWWYTEVTDD